MASGGKKSKRKDMRPARARYWLSGKLRTKKVKNIMRYMKLDRVSATLLWEKYRQGRRMRTHVQQQPKSN